MIYQQIMYKNGNWRSIMRCDIDDIGFEEVTIFGKPALFTPYRLKRDTVAVKCFIYEVRHDDDCDGDVVQLAKNIIVNHWGTLVTLEEIELPVDGYIDIEEKDINYGIAICNSIGDFIEKYS